MKRAAVVQAQEYLSYGLCRYLVEEEIEVDAYPSRAFTEREEWMMMEIGRNARFHLQEEQEKGRIEADVLFYCVPEVVNGAAGEHLSHWLERCRKQKVRFVLLSSSRVFNEQQTNCNESTLPNPDSPAQKQLVNLEEVVQGSQKLNWLIIRIPELIGEWHPSERYLDRNSLKEERLYITDAARGIIEIVNQPICNEIVHLVT